MKTQHCQLYKQNSISGRLKRPLHCIIHSELITQERKWSGCPVVTAIGQIHCDMNSGKSSWSGFVIVNPGHTTKHKPPYWDTKRHMSTKIKLHILQKQKQEAFYHILPFNAHHCIFYRKIIQVHHVWTATARNLFNLQSKPRLL